jgi:hypothetical protein
MVDMAWHSSQQQWQWHHAGMADQPIFSFDRQQQ